MQTFRMHRHCLNINWKKLKIIQHWKGVRKMLDWNNSPQGCNISINGILLFILALQTPEIYFNQFQDVSKGNYLIDMAKRIKLKDRTKEHIWKRINEGPNIQMNIDSKRSCFRWGVKITGKHHKYKKHFNNDWQCRATAASQNSNVCTLLETGFCEAMQ